MSALSFAEARHRIFDEVSRAKKRVATETVPLSAAAGRVLAEGIAADRAFPALSRSIRDGFAVRSIDLPGTLEIVGEVRAGETWNRSVGAKQAVEIMTGAPMPDGADAVVMVEHVTRSGTSVFVDKPAKAGQFVNRKGSELAAGAELIRANTRLDFAHIAALAAAGFPEVQVYRKPLVAVIPTGDEVVPVETKPYPHQVRNSNVWGLWAQIERAGGRPWPLEIVPDQVEATVRAIQDCANADLILLSGGVSAGRYDVVEDALTTLGAKFFFTRIRVQPGQPLVFGSLPTGQFFFGLPGNPLSTMVTFETMARAALDLIGGMDDVPLRFSWGRITQEFRHKPELTRFLPAFQNHDGTFTPVSTQGSSDLPAAARANCFFVARQEREVWSEGEWMEVLTR